ALRRRPYTESPINKSTRFATSTAVRSRLIPELEKTLPAGKRHSLPMTVWGNACKKDHSDPLGGAFLATSAGLQLPMRMAELSNMTFKGCLEA
ncbi:MAG: hypothetical protein ACK5V8_10450, partial [Betaproteobacteria bacterium]